MVAQGLHAVDRAVAADADQAVDLEPREPLGDPGDRLGVVAVDVVARGAEDRAAPGRVELGDRVEERVQVDVRDLGVEQAAEPLDDPDHLDAVPVGLVDRPGDRGVQGRGVAAGRQDADPLHALTSNTRRPARPPAGEAGSGRRAGRPGTFGAPP